LARSFPIEGKDFRMALVYGCLKARIVSNPKLQSSRHKNEIQYHLHTTLEVSKADGTAEQWDSAVNVGTNDSDDLLQYKLIFDFAHAITEKPSAASQELTGNDQLPALDFLRSDVLANTGIWRPSDIMDGTAEVQPVASLERLLKKAKTANRPIYIFGRKYTDGLGIHDVHMNQGSGSSFLNNGRDDHNDHNDVWQDGAVLVDLGEPEWAAYFTVFTQQMVPTNDLGNPDDPSHPVSTSDDGSLKGGDA
jgi:uncharacterized protein YukJ